MKNYLFILGAVLCFFTTTHQVFAENTAIYAQVASMQQQFPAGTQLITFDKIDQMEGIEHKEGKLIIKEPGIYFIMAAGQAGVKKETKEAGGFVDLWLIVNGQDVPNSGVRQFLATPQSTSVIVSQNILPLKKGDALSFGYSASKPSHGFISIEGKHTQPSIPGMIVSVYKIGSQ